MTTNQIFKKNIFKLIIFLFFLESKKIYPQEIKKDELVFYSEISPNEFRKSLFLKEYEDLEKINLKDKKNTTPISEQKNSYSNITDKENSSLYDSPLLIPTPENKIDIERNLISKSKNSFLEQEDKKRSSFINDSKKEFNPPSILYLSFFIAFFIFIGYVFFRKGFKNLNIIKNKNDSIISIISKVQIDPKRYIIVLKFRNEEILISSTETGIKTLSCFYAKTKKTKSMKKNKEEIIKKIPTLEKNYTRSASEASEILASSESKDTILGNALKRLSDQRNQIEKSKNTSQKKEIASAELKEKFYKNNDQNLLKENLEPAIEGFKSFYNNQFKNEFEKKVNNENKNKSDFYSGEDVTSLIREKLKSMQNLS